MMSQGLIVDLQEHARPAANRKRPAHSGHTERAATETPSLGTAFSRKELQVTHASLSGLIYKLVNTTFIVTKLYWKTISSPLIFSSGRNLCSFLNRFKAFELSFEVLEDLWSPMKPKMSKPLTPAAA